MDDIALLHLYSPLHHHSDQHVVGNREGLLRLRAAIDRALEEGVGVETAFTNDGEGYYLNVVQDDRPWEEWPHEDPYINPYYSGEVDAGRPGYDDEVRETLVKMQAKFRA
jgi:hypothetical protein